MIHFENCIRGFKRCFGAENTTDVKVAHEESESNCVMKCVSGKKQYF